MAGTKAGGLKAAKKNKENYGEDFYRFIGAIGGRRGHTGGFASNPHLAKIAGAKGGAKSRRRNAEETCRLRDMRRAAKEEFRQEAEAFFKKHEIDAKVWDDDGDI